MGVLRDAFFTEGQRLTAADDPAADCWICHTPINYAVRAGTTEDSHNLDHFYPVSTHPELQYDSDNFRHAHKRCNESRGNRAVSPGLGEVVPAWW